MTDSIDIVTCLSEVEQIRSTVLRAHESMVGKLCFAFCEAAGFRSDYSAKLLRAAALHDIGKVTIPDAILNKPGMLDPDEWNVMRDHTRLGHAILNKAADETIALAASIALHHHECWDGSGYPDGLAGDAIPHQARVVGLCDVYHALREIRPYKAALRHEEVVGKIVVGDGRVGPSKFDPELLSIFAANEQMFGRIYDDAA
ncbi:HD-GYP domain-containing protein [Dongia sedimenti]|uniref:HD domain-containing phosphohydrolase n=1 Tax=Dongia sedimenti TaxID=3064282 RepID=A0ABU0YGU3_9PROT|nr:HD domain-containing phosphohydrolase [Rhodospirillaceae bacterium R-7]